MEYAYYLIYKFVLLTPSHNEQPEHIANFSLALVLSFTLFGIMNILEYFNLYLLEELWLNKIWFVMVYLSFVVLGYIFFIRHKKYIEIRRKLDKGNRNTKIRNASFFVSYIIALIVLNFIVP